MDDAQVVRAFRRFRETPRTTFTKKLLLRIKEMPCQGCGQVIGNKAWRLHGDAVECSHCSHEIGGGS